MTQLIAKARRRSSPGRRGAEAGGAALGDVVIQASSNLADGETKSSQEVAPLATTEASAKLGGPKEKGAPKERLVQSSSRGRNSAGNHLILVSLNSTCLRAIGSYLVKVNFSVLV